MRDIPMERYDEEPAKGLPGMVSLHRVAEAARQGGTGAVARGLRVQESQTTSDFAHFADLIDRGVKTGYLEELVPTNWEKLGYRRDTVDLARAGSKGLGRDYEIYAPRDIPQVAEKGEYKPLDPAETYYSFHTYKYGCQWDLSWEAWLADGRNLSLLGDYPNSWGMSARNTRQKLFTAAFANNTVFFTGGNGNLMSGAGSALDFANLDTAITAITNFTDPSGNVLVYGGGLKLVVPPALTTTARQLVDPSWLIANKLISMDIGMGTTGGILMNYGIEVVTDPFLPVVDSTYGNTAWYLFCDPRLRPAMRYGFLAGYENVEIFVKSAEAQLLASGTEDPFAGSFLTDDISFKCRFTWGVDTVDWRGAYMSTGEAEAET